MKQYQKDYNITDLNLVGFKEACLGGDREEV
jgi:hypothetical protein